MKDHKFWRSVENFAVGRGFYIVLALCITAVGMTGYYLLDTVTKPMGAALSVETEESEIQSAGQEALLPPVQTPVKPVQSPVEVTLPEPVEPTVQTPAESAQPALEPEITQSVPAVFTWPVKGEILRDFSVETLSLDPTMGDWRTHAGVDVAAKLGTRVLCMTAGSVSEIWEDSALGTCIRVDHGGKMESVYANLSPQPTVKVGDQVEIGEIIGAVGDTAQSEIGMSPHLHLEVFRDGKSMDPLELLPAQ